MDKAGQRSRATENQISASTYPSPMSSALRAAERDASSCTQASAAIEATAIAAPLRDAIRVYGIATLRQVLRSALQKCASCCCLRPPSHTRLDRDRDLVGWPCPPVRRPRRGSLPAAEPGLNMPTEDERN